MADNGTRGRIVVGVDGSAPSRRALRWAVEQAARTGATVDVIAAWEYPVGYGWGPVVVDVDEYIKGFDQALHTAVTEVAGARPAVPVTARLVEGHPAVVLLDAAAGADLLVLGCRGHGGFTGALLGSVSQHCAQHAPCPVVIVRGDGRP